VLGFLCFWVARIMNRREYDLAPRVAAQMAEFGETTTVIESRRADGTVMAPPSTGTVIGLIALPIVQILVGTMLSLSLPAGSAGRGIATFIGTPALALLVAVIVAFFVLPVRRRWGLARTNEVFESSMPPIASILLVVAGGGVFGAVLQASGIGTALSVTLENLGVPLLGAAFLITLALRAAQGSATVAIVTTASLLSAAVAEAGYSPVQIAAVFGSLGLSMVTDAGFWIVTRYLGLTVADGLRTWTVLTTILGVAGFLLTWAVFALAG
jgi:GntP family gluconate:H+ symporter